MAESIFHKLSHPDVQQFIAEHERHDEKALLLKHKLLFGLPTSVVVNQVVGRRKAKEKLPSFYANSKIIYPPSLNVEQASSETTASFKVELLKSLDIAHHRLIDLTGGFGVDVLFFSKAFQQVDYVERNAALLELVQHNASMIGRENISFHNTAAEEFLAINNDSVDVFYIDPSRRTEGDKKVFRLSECEPNVVTLAKSMFEKCAYILIKTSPLFDIQLGIKELPNVFQVFVVAVKNDCKEVLFLCKKHFEGEPGITAVNLESDDSDFKFSFQDEKELSINCAEVNRYLYEPNVAILKSGAFKVIGQSFGVDKLDVNSHLYTSKNFNISFPGRVFEVMGTFKSDSRAALEICKAGKANIILRNYPSSVEALRKKLKLGEGGDDYIIGTTACAKPVLLYCKRLK